MNCRRCNGNIIKEPGCLDYCEECGLITDQAAASKEFDVEMKLLEKECQGFDVPDRWGESL